MRPWWNFLDIANKLWFVLTTGMYIVFVMNLEAFLKRVATHDLETGDFTQIESLSVDWVRAHESLSVHSASPSLLTSLRFSSSIW